MIDKIEVFITQLPIRLKRVIASGIYDTGPPEQLLGKPVLVKIHADGVVGYGQIRPIAPGHFVADTTQSVVSAITDIYAPLMLGRRLFDIEVMNELFDARLPENPAARAVLDIALFDAMGKALNTPVYNLLGGCCQPRLPLEWSVSMADDVSVMIAEASRAIQEFGIRVLCMKAAGRCGWRQDVENFEAIRRAVGDEVEIGIDPNTGWTVAQSISAVRALRDLNVAYIEQPVERRDLKGLAAVRREAAGVPLMADESLFTLRDAHALVEANAVDAFCIKLYKVGGLMSARKIAAVAEAANIQINCGGIAVLSQLEAAAAAHFYASMPVKRTLGAGEFLFGLGVMGPDPLAPNTDFVLRDGHVDVPRGPGLGIAIDEAALKKHALQHVDIVK